VLKTMLLAKLKSLPVSCPLLGVSACGALLFSRTLLGVREEPPAGGRDNSAPIALAPGGASKDARTEETATPAGDPAGKGAKADGAVTRRFEDLAAQLKMFPTGELAYGRAGDADRLIPKQWTEPWLKVYAALSAATDDMASLIALLKHDNPNVRALALAVLFDRQDPRMLPHLAAMMDDTAKTVPEVRIVRAFAVLPPQSADLVPQDFREQTVGRIARVFLETWMRPARCKAEEFDAYWAARKNRAFCASWYVARVYRAGQGSSHFDKSRAPLIRAVRKEIDALPAVDRNWTLLWVASHSDQPPSEEPRRILATPEELLEAAKQLGAERLMDLIQDRPISSDPDLAERRYLILWVLHHAGKLLRPEDAPAILALEKSLDSPWCALAAAELQPEKARDWLRPAIGRFAGNPIYTHLSHSRAELAAGLWRIVGEREIDYLADWFYSETVNKHPHSTQTEAFLRAIKGVRAPADRKLVARLVTDPRLDKLDYQTLRALVEVVNQWAKVAVIPADKLRPIWEKGTWGPETPADFVVVAGWRTQLRNSAAGWKVP
jgi:hypothetical protein